MKTVVAIRGMRVLRERWRDQKLTVALVPTMGYLHEGHFSLMRKAARLADQVVVSIFVNPTQFGPGEDYASYPRNKAADLAACRRLGVAAVFMPTVGAMYADDHSAYVIEEQLSRPLCGRCRPGHFRGVATVVLKLFNIVAPQIAVFGDKDAQQVSVVRRMTRDLNCPVRIVVAPTVRERDGLAASSRNARLSREERALAPRLWQALTMARGMAKAGQRAATEITHTMRAMIEDGGKIKVEYIEIVDSRSLQPVTVVQRGVMIALAAKLGAVRLIDHIAV